MTETAQRDHVVELIWTAIDQWVNVMSFVVRASAALADPAVTLFGFSGQVAFSFSSHDSS